STSASLAQSFNMKRREIIESAEYQSLWPTAIKDDINTQQRFENTSNGFMMAISVGGTVIGRGADILLSDDLLDANDAFSRSKRENCNLWYSTSFYNRLQDKRKPKRINIMQRLHANDLSWYLDQKYNF